MRDLAIALLLSAAPVQPPPFQIQTVRVPPRIVTSPTPTPSRFGSWIEEDMGTWTQAFTSNASGSTFGIYCGKDCTVFLDLQTSCDEGHEYPAMLNSAKGSLSINLLCHILDKRYIFSTAATTNYTDILSGTGEVGFAIPLASGRFSVSRFSLDGGLPAVNAAVTEAVRKGKSQEGLRDFSI